MPVETASGDAAAAQESRQSGAGELLQKGRRDLGLSLEQVSDNLHLDERVIEALEAERFDEIGATVFVRGHLKAYARVLRMDEDQVLGAYRATLPEVPVEPVFANRAPVRKLALNPGPVGLGVVAAVLVIGLAVYVLQGGPDDKPVTSELPPALPVAETAPPPSEPVETAVETLVPLATGPEPAVGDLTSADAASVERSELPVADEQPEPAPPSAEPMAQTPVEAEAAGPPPARVELELYFREESWVEISDDQRRILFGLQREGMRRQLSGEPPIRILLGNAPGVDIYLDSRPYAIPARNVNGKVARFTIDPVTEGAL